MEAGAATDLGIQPDVATMHLHEALCQGQPDSDAAFGVVDLPKRGEDILIVGFGNPGTGVGDPNVEDVVISGHGDTQLTLFGELDGVVHQEL